MKTIFFPHFSQLYQGGKENLKHRKVKHFGYEFMYGINNVDRNRPLVHGIPSACDLLIQQLMEEKHLDSRPDQLTVNQYQPGQGKHPWMRL